MPFTQSILTEDFIGLDGAKGDKSSVSKLTAPLQKEPLVPLAGANQLRATSIVLRGHQVGAIINRPHNANRSMRAIDNRPYYSRHIYEGIQAILLM